MQANVVVISLFVLLSGTAFATKEECSKALAAPMSPGTYALLRALHTRGSRDAHALADDANLYLRGNKPALPWGWRRAWAKFQWSDFTASGAAGALESLRAGYLVSRHEQPETAGSYTVHRRVYALTEDGYAMYERGRAFYEPLDAQND